jgi:hypothetical protein
LIIAAILPADGREDGLQAPRLWQRRRPLGESSRAGFRSAPVFLLAVGLIAGTDGLGLVEPAKLGELGVVPTQVVHRK